MAGLSQDVARAGPDLKRDYADLMQQVAEEVAKGISADISAKEKQQRAWTFLTSLIGALIVARAAGSEPMAAHVSDITKASAVAAFRAGT